MEIQNSEDKNEISQSWGENKFSFPILNIQFMCLRTSINMYPLPLYANFMEGL